MTKSKSARSKRYTKNADTALARKAKAAARDARGPAAREAERKVGGVAGKKLGTNVERTDESLARLKIAVRKYAIEGISAYQVCKDVAD